MIAQHNSVITKKNFPWLVIILLAALICAHRLCYPDHSQAKICFAESRFAREEHVVESLTGERLDEEKEKELRKALNELRQAIKEYKQVCDEGLVGPIDRKKDDNCYPPTLKTLVDGIQPPNRKYYICFLRRIPTDPMTGTQEWGLRSAQDEKDAETWGGENVFDVYSKSAGIAADGTRYREW